MSIGFVCEHCGQKLTVSSSRAGQRGNCPKCRRPVVVPQASREAPPANAPVSPARPPAPEQTPAPQAAKPASPVPVPTPTSVAAPPAVAPQIAEPLPSTPDPTPPAEAPRAAADLPDWIAQSQHEREESPWIYVDSVAAPSSELAKPPSLDVSKVSIPRFVVFAQGAALGVVALVAFALGILAGGGSRSSPDGPAGADAPCVVSGKVEHVTSGGTKFPDEGAVVLLFPQDQRPATEERAAAFGLRPEDPPPNAAVPGLQMLRLMGAVSIRTDVAGQFRVSLPRGGKYYLLVVSHHAGRRQGREISRADLAAIGRYITSPADLIGDRRYRWRVEEFQRDAEVLVVLD